MKDTICVIIPAYNVADTIGDMVKGAMRYVRMVMVADDGSGDGTGDVALSVGADVISIQRNRGKGNALKVLFKEAAKQGYTTVISMDGDGQHNPDEIPRLIHAHRENPGNIVVGSRMHSRENIPRARYNSMHVARFFISLAANQFIEDTQCGYRVYPLALIQQMALTQEKYVTESEILIKAGDMGIAIDFVRIGAIYGEIHSHFRPVLDVTAITAYIISYFPLKFFTEAVVPGKLNTYTKGNLRDWIARHRLLDNLFKVVTAVIGIPMTVICLLGYHGLPILLGDNFVSMRTLGHGFYKITLAALFLPVILVVIIFEKLFSYIGIKSRFVDGIIQRFYPHLWGTN
ncbi:MAG: glycosyltransferase family 2 protein [Desulfobacterales bacterium]|nr:glycosyltransferase family 2 protein [Desulfobacterales bacterium]MDX2512025.1 glycosyltransferase family 2 protein [Desulfobacterales bacterium]